MEAVMATRANPLSAIASEPEAEAPFTPVLTRLAQVHAEAVETARLANLLGRSLYATGALAAIAVAALAAGGGAGLSQAVAWAILMAVGLLAMARAYAFAIRQPFERAALHAFSQDMRACLLYAGFAWGAGAFLALPAAAPALAVLVFAAAPALSLAVLLREREAVLPFVAPAAGLSSLACAARPFSGSTLAVGSVLMGCAIVAIAIEAIARVSDKRDNAALPHAFIAP
jgi:hypothetical protein